MDSLYSIMQVKGKHLRKGMKKMSKRSYWKMRPAAERVYISRQRQDAERDMRILARGMYTAAALVFVFGVCMGNFELLAISGALALLGKMF